MPQFRIADAAELLGISYDTLRRWVDAGKLPVEFDQSHRRVIEGAALAAFARDQARPAPDRHSWVARSARNRFVGLVTDVTAGPVMTQIEVQCGPHRVVSLMSTEAAQELGLAPGMLAVAVIKSTNVIVETVTRAMDTVVTADAVPAEGEDA
ncbi:MAG TPA: TOBE domain-containing protein [Pseudonocardiaceae bacterium]